ncbi:hypothetical protein BFW87_25640 [Pseudomonas fluorescens]|uniref:EF-hand domain-containing protein n=2 Tax=Pseudomonas fluorescens TaxID=294 RepID=A0A1T2Y2V4_PSEFL|nr:hypothetical protein BFW87_25640 [Pseudomonas fluorescens]
MLVPAFAMATPGFGNFSADQAMSKLNARFAQADVDHDGKLTKAEANAGMPRLAAHFDEIDSTHQGFITLEKIKGFMQSRAGG